MGMSVAKSSSLSAIGIEQLAEVGDLVAAAGEVPVETSLTAATRKMTKAMSLGQ